MLSEFDITTISDPGIYQEFVTLQKRTNAIAADFMRTFGAGRKPIRFRYVDQHKFNAYAFADENNYCVELTAAVPLLNIMFCSRLFSDPEFLPHLSHSGKKVSAYNVPAIVDPRNFDLRQDWEISLTKERSHAALMVADFCSTYVSLHELSHILAGHVDGIQHLEGRSRITELISQDDFQVFSTARNRAWEWDADLLAASSMVHFFDEFLRLPQERSQALFARPEDPLYAERTLAGFAVMMFLFFYYVEGLRLKERQSGTHPNPMARAYQLYDGLASAAARLGLISVDKLMKVTDETIDHFYDATDRLGLTDTDKWDDDFWDRALAERDAMNAQVADFRPEVAEWCWIPWGE